jgi:hypothetical protein
LTDVVLAVLLIVGAILGILMVAGLIAGQARRGVISELRASLATANEQIALERQRGDRLERLMEAQRRELETLGAEHALVRDLLRGGGHLQPAIVQAIATAVDEGIDKVAGLIREGRAAQ